MADIKAFYDEQTGTVSYIVSDPKAQAAAFIDPVLNYDAASASLKTTSADAMLAFAQEHELCVVWSLDTHVHADHLTASDYVRQQTGAQIGIGIGVRDIREVFGDFYNLGDVEMVPNAFEVLFEDGDVFQIGSVKVRVLHTPGHTPACVTYLVDDAAFVGDTLFMPDFGTARTDFPGGDARTLYRSIRKILSLPKTTRIFVGHDYISKERSEAAWETSVAEQARSNIHAKVGVDEDSFVDVRTRRDATLKVPALILPSLQVNIRAGRLPDSEGDGEIYLKIPLNKLEGPADRAR